MSKLMRHKVNKHHSRKKFTKSVGRTKAANVKAGPMRGGIRL